MEQSLLLIQKQDFFVAYGMSSKMVHGIFFMIFIKVINSFVFGLTRYSYDYYSQILNDPKNLLCVLIDDILFPHLIGQLVCAVAPLLITTSLLSRNILYLVLNMAANFYASTQLLYGMRLEEYVDNKYFNLSCLSKNQQKYLLYGDYLLLALMVPQAVIIVLIILRVHSFLRKEAI